MLRGWGGRGSCRGRGGSRRQEGDRGFCYFKASVDNDRRVSQKHWKRMTVCFAIIRPLSWAFLLLNTRFSPFVSSRTSTSPEGMGGLGHENIAEMRVPVMTGWRASHCVALGGVGGAVEACLPAPSVGLPGGLRELDQKGNEGIDMTPAGLTRVTRIHEPRCRVRRFPVSILPRRPLPFSAHFRKQHV